MLTKADNLNWNLSNFRSLRTSPQTGVAISWIEALFFIDEFRKMVQKSSLYDDRLPRIRWGFPRQCAHWLGMTRSDGPLNSILTMNPSPTEMMPSPAKTGEGIVMLASFLRYFPAAPMRIWARSESPSRMTVFSSPFRLCFRASRARVNS